MEIKNITNQIEWDDWLKNQSPCSFTQSFDWGEIITREGKRVERIQFVEGDKIFGAAQLVLNKASGFEYFFCPKGPILKSQNPNTNDQIYKMIEKYCIEKKVVFLRFEPEQKIEFDSKSAYRKSIDVNPRATTILNLQQSEQELLEEMHSKTRYNIRLAEKKNITIENKKDFESFWNLMSETGKRDGFRLHDKKHYEEIFKSDSVKQLTAVVDNKTIATVVLIGFGETLTYLFGASDYEHRPLMAPHLLQWEAIKLAKSMGFKSYDFFGIAPRKVGFSGSEYEYDGKHQYAGVTRFKIGFGGEVIEWPGTFDLIAEEGKYKLYEALRKIRRLI